MSSIEKTNINTKEYLYYSVHCNAKELSKKERIWITATSVLLGLYTLGLFNLVCHLAFKNRKASLLDRHKDDMIKRVTFLSLRLQKQPENATLIKAAKSALDQTLRQALVSKSDERVAQLRKVASKMDDLKQELPNSVYKNIGAEARSTLNLELKKALKEREAQLSDTISSSKVLEGKEKILKTKDWNYAHVGMVISDIKTHYQTDLEKQQQELEQFFREMDALKDPVAIIHSSIGMAWQCLDEKKIIGAMSYFTKAQEALGCLDDKSRSNKIEMIMKDLSDEISKLAQIAGVEEKIIK